VGPPGRIVDAMDRTDVQATLREMWETRPARPREGRKIAGVAAAIARRYDVDPVLVRVAFVVAALTGIGLWLYLAGWIVLPAVNGGAVRRERPPTVLLVIGLVVLAVLSIGWVVHGEHGVLLSTVAAAALLFMLHRSRGDRGRPPMDAPTESVPAPPVGAGPPPAAGQPPAWDPLGAAPFAWDLPEPSAAADPPPRRRPPVTAVTLALALLAGGVTTAVLLAVGGGLAALPVLLGVVLAVLGGGLVVGSFLRAGRGLVPIALVLAALTWAAVAAPLEDWDGRVGEVRAAPRTVADVAPLYSAGVGSLELDLRQLDLRVPSGEPATPVTTAVRADVGDVQVRVPPDADVTVHGSVDLGHIEFEDWENGGPSSRLDVVDDLGTDGLRSGRPIVLDIKAGMGSVEVERG
jgi:phage shock protein PspC (stress-responsive transcriptional regulator)